MALVGHAGVVSVAASVALQTHTVTAAAACGAAAMLAHLASVDHTLASLFVVTGLVVQAALVVVAVFVAIAVVLAAASPVHSCCVWLTWLAMPAGGLVASALVAKVVLSLAGWIAHLPMHFLVNVGPLAVNLALSVVCVSLRCQAYWSVSSHKAQKP